MNRALFLALCLGFWNTTAALAQDWADVQALPPETTIRVVAKGGELRGRLASVDETQLTVFTRGKPWILSRGDIVRLEREIRDPLWNGMLIGALATLVLRIASYSEACLRDSDPACTLKGVAVGAAFGAFVDFQIRRHPVIYRAPQPIAPTATFLRWSF